MRLISTRISARTAAIPAAFRHHHRFSEPHRRSSAELELIADRHRELAAHAGAVVLAGPRPRPVDPSPLGRPPDAPIAADRPFTHRRIA